MLTESACLMTHVGAAACSSQRDSDRVFEHKLLSLRRLHFPKALRGPTRAVPKLLPLRTGSAACRFWHNTACCVPARRGEAKVSGCVGQSGGTDSDPTYGRQAASIREKAMKLHSPYRLDLG